MTQEERLKEAKRLYETANADQRYVLESLFPELKESDDERTRKELIDFIKSHLAGFLQCEKYIAWIEKQGETNPYSGVSFEYNGHTWSMCARDGGVEIGCDKQLIAYVNLPQEKNEFDNLSKVIDNKLTNCNTGDFIMSTVPNCN